MTDILNWDEPDQNDSDPPNSSQDSDSEQDLFIHIPSNPSPERLSKEEELERVASKYVQLRKLGQKVLTTNDLGTYLKKEELVESFNDPSLPFLSYFSQFKLEPPFTPTLPYLTRRQLEVLQVVTDPYDARSLPVLLKKAESSLEEFRAWLEDPEFKQAYFIFTKQSSRDAAPEVVRNLSAKATKGDAKAVDQFLKVHQIGQEQTVDPTDVLLEVLQKLLDTDQLKQVAEKLKEVKELNP